MFLTMAYRIRLIRQAGPGIYIHLVVMRTLKYIGRLVGEFFEFAWQNKAWWIIPIVFVLLILTVFIVTGSSVAPFIYTLF